MLILYDYELSGNCYKIRLLLSILGLEYRSHVVEFYPAAEYKEPWFLEINPLGELPVLRDGDFTLRESQAILIYLASRYDNTKQWYPTADAKRLAKVSQWLAFADSITATASRARLADTFFFDFNATQCQHQAHALFRVLDEHLWFHEQQQYDWIVADANPTIADIACFPYIMLCEEGGISCQDNPAIRRWCDRLKRIPGFCVMPGIFPAGPAPKPEQHDA